MRRISSAKTLLVVSLLAPASLDAGSVQSFSHPDGVLTQRADGPSSPHTAHNGAKKDRTAPTAVTVLAVAPTMASIHLHECVVADPSAMRPIAEQSFSRIDWLLRDRTNWQARSMDSSTLATVLATAAHFQGTRIEVISGYRSPKMNEMLRKKGRHVAQRSQHPMATAVDFRIIGVPMASVFQLLEREHNGGVGRYRNDAFVHVDAGPRRRWRGE